MNGSRTTTKPVQKATTAKMKTHKTNVKKFVGEFYSKHGKVISKLAHE